MAMWDLPHMQSTLSLRGSGFLSHHLPFHVNQGGIPIASLHCLQVFQGIIISISLSPGRPPNKLCGAHSKAYLIFQLQLSLISFYTLQHLHFLEEIAIVLNIYFFPVILVNRIKLFTSKVVIFSKYETYAKSQKISSSIWS